LTTSFVKISPLLFLLAATASTIGASPVAAAQQSLLPIRSAAFPADLRAALQQKLGRTASAACGTSAQPRLAHCADEAPSPLGNLDWIQQIVTGDDLADYAMFGTSVSIDGTVAVVGSPQLDPIGSAQGNGAAYVFTRTADGWTQTQKLVADDGAFGDNFGISVAVQGDTVLVGAYNATIGANDKQGAVYVFRPLAGAWTQTQKLSPSDAPAGRMVGAWISLDGDNALVSTPAGMMGDDPSTAPVYALHQDNGSWSIAQTIEADDYSVGDVFGMQTAVRGTTAVIGAPGANVLEGAAYVFNYANGAWTQTQKLSPSDTGEMLAFGWSVALDGNNALFGAPYANVGDYSMQGSAYVFHLEDGNWAQTQKLTPVIGVDDCRFGLTVALSGETAVVATPWTKEVEGVASYGGVWVYTAAGDDGFVPQSTLLAPTSDVTTFGYSASLSAGTLLTGDPISGKNLDIGSAVIYAQDRIFTNGFDGATP